MTDKFDTDMQKQDADERAAAETASDGEAVDGASGGERAVDRNAADARGEVPCREVSGGEAPRADVVRGNADEESARGDKREEAPREEAAGQVVVRGRNIEKADVFKFAGLIAFFALMILICALLWPYFHELFEPGGIDRIINDVRDAGPVGFLILLGLQFLQIVVAFIPGEVVQVAAGMLYGPWIGGLFILIGCVLSSAFIFALVHKLGAPFVQSMVPTQYLEKFRRFEQTGKLNIIVFVLFLIPGLPKDVFTYLVPLTDMRMRTFLLLSNIGRIPGIIVSTYAADGLVEGRIVESVVIFAVAAVIALLGILLRERIMGLLDKTRHKDK